MSTKKSRILSLVCALTVGALTLSACGAADTGTDGASKVVYVVPSSWSSMGSFQENIAAWEAKTGNEVEVQAIPDDQYDSTVQARISGRQGMDIYAGQDNTADASSIMLEIKDEAFKDRLIPGAYDQMKAADGKVYGFPAASGLSSWGVFYNKDVFKGAGVDVPKSLSELDKAYSKLKSDGVNPLFLSGKDGWTLLQHRNAVNAQMFKSNPDIASSLSDNKTKWADAPGFTDQYEALSGWVKDGYINDGAVTATYEQSLKALAAGEAATVISTSEMIGALRAQDKDANIGFFPLPAMEGKSQIGLSRVNIMHISSFSKAVDESKDLLRFMTEKAQVESFLAAAPGIPAFTDVEVASPDPIIADIQVYVDAEQFGPAFDTSTTFPTPNGDLIASYQELIAGRLDVPAFTEKVQTAWNTAGKTAGRDGF